MKKVLFFIHDLGQGGAEKVLVNLVNNLDKKEFSVTVLSMFDHGINKQFLNDDVHYKSVFSRVFRGNSHVLKLFSPRILHNLFIKEKYDIEISFLEGPCARIISGCESDNTKKICWIHSKTASAKGASVSFRSIKEAENCYNSFDKIVFVSQDVLKAFSDSLDIRVPVEVLHNVNESEKIQKMSEEQVTECSFPDDKYKIVCVGKLEHNKGFDRVLSCVSRLKKEGISVCVYLLGSGSMESYLKELALKEEISDSVVFLGYQTNPYKFISKCDLFVCSSYSEGFSTATTEAIILGIPVCSVEVAGAKEMLGENNEFGIVTKNEDEALYTGIKSLLEDPVKLENYKTQSFIRGKSYSREETVKTVEETLKAL